MARESGALAVRQETRSMIPSSRCCRTALQARFRAACQPSTARDLANSPAVRCAVCPLGALPGPSIIRPRSDAACGGPIMAGAPMRVFLRQRGYRGGDAISMKCPVCDAKAPRVRRVLPAVRCQASRRSVARRRRPPRTGQAGPRVVASADTTAPTRPGVAAGAADRRRAGRNLVGRDLLAQGDARHGRALRRGHDRAAGCGPGC